MLRILPSIQRSASLADSMRVSTKSESECLTPPAGLNRNVQRYEVVDGTIAPFFLHHLNPTATTRRKSFLNAWARHAVCDGAQAWSTVSAWHGHRWLAMRLTRPVAVLSCPVVHDIAYIDAVYTSGRCPIMSGRARPDSVTQASRTGLSANWTRTSEQSSTATTKGLSHACSHENRSYRRRWAP